MGEVSEDRGWEDYWEGGVDDAAGVIARQAEEIERLRGELDDERLATAAETSLRKMACAEIERLRDCAKMLRRHLSLFCSRSDQVAAAVFGLADAVIAGAAPPPPTDYATAASTTATPPQHPQGAEAAQRAPGGGQ